MAAGEQVVARAAVQRVVADPAVEAVVAGAPVEGVVAALAEDDVVARAAVEGLAADSEAAFFGAFGLGRNRLRNDRVIAAAGMDLGDARRDVDHVRARRAADRVPDPFGPRCAGGAGGRRGGARQDRRRGRKGRDRKQGRRQDRCRSRVAPHRFLL